MKNRRDIFWLCALPVAIMLGIQMGSVLGAIQAGLAGSLLVYKVVINYLESE